MKQFLIAYGRGDRGRRPDSVRIVLAPTTEGFPNPPLRHHSIIVSGNIRHLQTIRDVPVCRGKPTMLWASHQPFATRVDNRFSATRNVPRKLLRHDDSVSTSDIPRRLLLARLVFLGKRVAHDLRGSC
jgi:hypothetical protein